MNAHHGTVQHLSVMLIALSALPVGDVRRVIVAMELVVRVGKKFAAVLPSHLDSAQISKLQVAWERLTNL